MDETELNPVANVNANDNKNINEIIPDGIDESFIQLKDLYTSPSQIETFVSEDLSKNPPMSKHEFEYGLHGETQFDELPSLKGSIENIVKFDEENPELINHGTIKALIVQLTSPEIIDYNLIYDFFITYRMFSDSETVMKYLMIRLIWSLQKINNLNNQDDVRLGKLVLLRTFVVLRHWILNYFIDDFNNNFKLCDEFIKNLNNIIFNSDLVKSEMVFEIKILKDLKTHWINLIIEFWGVDLNLNNLIPDILYFKLPLSNELLANSSKKLVKSSTEISLHTNPSYRRSAMLSLYDSNINYSNNNANNGPHHKVLVFDDSKDLKSDENPQLSINNLLIQHQSSRQSIMNKINHFNFNLNLRANKERNSLSPTNNLMINAPKNTNNSNSYNNNKHNTKNVPIKSPLSSITKHNRMNLNDSSTGLKKISNSNQRISNNLHKISLNPIQIDNVGFSTNGNIKLPSSKIFNIVPSTPVKKMEYIIRNPKEFDGDNIINNNSNDNNDIINEEELDDTFEKPNTQVLDNNSDLNRKRSLKKILESWKKSVYHKSNENFDELIDDEANKDLIGDRYDILTARIIDELEFLIRYYIQGDSYNATIIEGDTIDNSQPIDKDEIDIDEFDNSVDLMGSPAKQYHVTNSNFQSPILGKIKDIDDSIDDDDDMDINDLSELNLKKIDNLINDEPEVMEKNDGEDRDQDVCQSRNEDNNNTTSYNNFPVNTNINTDNNIINNDDDDDDDDNLEFKDTRESLTEKAISPISPGFANEIHEFSFQRPTSINWNDEGDINFETSENHDLKINDVDGSSLPEPNLVEPPFTLNNRNDSRISTISTPSNITDYDAEIHDLGIALSPRSMKDHTKRISIVDKRFSKSSSNSIFKRDSIKSYISYDSAFSVSNNSILRHNNQSYQSHNQSQNNINNFVEVDSEEEDDDKGLKKKAGIKDLRRLAGLPTERKSLENPVRVHSLTSTRKSIRYSTVRALSELPFNNGSTDSKLQRFSRLSDIAGRSSIFSMANRSKNSIANSIQTLNDNNSRISMSINSFSNHNVSHSHSNLISNGEGDNSKHSIAIPGISSNVLKELAAIPDESFHFNPIESTLGKLEGKRSLNGSGSDITHVDDTQEILDEINNANTEDIIESLSVVNYDASNSDQENYIQQEPPLTPKIERNHSILNKPSSMTPNGKIIVPLGDHTNEPTTVTTMNSNLDNDNDNVFIFSANFTNSTTKQSYSPNDLKPLNYGNTSNMLLNTNDENYQSPRFVLETYNLSSDELNIENIFSKNNHISFLLSYSSQQLSEHFTIIERDILQEIDWKELIELKWNKELTPVNSWLEIIVNEDYYNSNKGVNLVIARFNLMVNWIISEILLTKDQTERIGIISRFIHIAKNCLVLQNYSTLMQILLALTSEKISKLKDTWKNLHPGDILILKNLEQLSSPIKNFINLRVSINQIQPSKGSIPFVGLYLSDLIFNTERPKFIKKNPDNVNDSLINFARFRTSVHIVKSLSQCIEWSSYYNLPIDNELLSKCLYLRSLDEDEMNYCLENIEFP